MNANEEKPLVSVIVTTFNRKELLAETIQSILAQTYRNFELIVVDNYSNYDFFSHIASFGDDRISPFQNRNNGIIAVNRNYGIEKARGDYIAFCDDDDLWESEKLEEQLKHFEDDRVAGVGSEMTLFGAGLKDERRSLQEDRFLDFRKIIASQNVPLSSLIVRRTGQLFDVEQSFIAVEDFDFQIRLVLPRGNVIRQIAKPLIRYRVNSQNRNSGLQQKLNSLMVIEKYRSFLDLRTARSLYHLVYYRAGKICLEANARGRCRRYFMKSIRFGIPGGKKGLKCIGGLFLSFLPVQKPINAPR